MFKSSCFFFFLTFFSITISFAQESDSPVQKVSKLGVVFTLDTTYPELGEAYRDPTGLIWGDIVMDGYHVKQVNYSEAETYCRNIGARLPTNTEWLQFGKFLGAGKWDGYSPLTKDRNDEILNGLTHYWFWSSTPYWLNPKVFQYIYWGNSGVTEDGQKKSSGGAIHCVISTH